MYGYMVEQLFMARKQPKRVVKRVGLARASSKKEGSSVEYDGRRDYYTVGVRFARGPNPSMVFTYRVKKGGKIKLGDEVIADTIRGPSVAFVVEIHAEPRDSNTLIEYRYLTRKSVPL
jgi:hypothetical protein